MFVIIGLVVVFGCVLGGYMMHGGNIGILWQISEVIIIGGAAIGSFVAANPMSVIKATIAGILGTLKGSGLNKEAYIELLQMMYELFQLAKKEGVIGLEQHIENPESSSIFTKYPTFLANHHAVDFLCDTLKVVLNGGVANHDLEDMMDLDLETMHHEEMKAPGALTTVGDALPGLGIVAAVLGVIITMGKIDQSAEIIGHSVAAALVGTFLGILLSYGLAAPVARAMEQNLEAQGKYLIAIKAGVLSFVKGAPPVVAVEYARRAVTLDARPSFQETEEAVKQAR